MHGVRTGLESFGDHIKESDGQNVPCTQCNKKIEMLFIPFVTGGKDPSAQHNDKAGGQAE